MTMETIEQLQTRFTDAVDAVHNFRGDDTVRVKPESWVKIFTFLRDDAGFDQWIDLTAADYLNCKDGQGREQGLPRFEVVVHLRRMKDGTRLRIKARLPENSPGIDTLSGLYKGADWMERECHEMYGIVFTGHPDLRPLLLYPEFEGYPLRKDYPIGQRQPRIPLLSPEDRRFPIPEDLTPHGHAKKSE